MWHWETDPDSTIPESGTLLTFETQADAEAWLTATYEDLIADGVGTVSLYEGERLVYGPMSLEPA